MADLWGTTSKGERVNLTQERLKRDRLQAKRDLINADKKESLFTYGLVSKIFGMICCLLLIVGLYRTSQGYSIPLFSDLLNLIANAPQISIPMFGTQLVTLLSFADFGLFNFIKYLLRPFALSLDLVIFLTNGVLSVIQYLYYILRWVFVF